MKTRDKQMDKHFLKKYCPGQINYITMLVSVQFVKYLRVRGCITEC